jgi:hypothetical protein
MASRKKATKDSATGTETSKEEAAEGETKASCKFLKSSYY